VHKRVHSSRPLCRAFSAWVPHQRSGQECRKDETPPPPIDLSPSTAVLVRIHNGTSDDMLHRHVMWGKQLLDEAGGGVRLWMLADETFGGNAVYKRFKQILGETGASEEEVPYFSYTEADMSTTFSVLSELRKSMPNTQIVRDCFVLPCQKSLAWGFHMESILLWWAALARGHAEPATVWVIEDDAGYSGSIASFVRDYSIDHGDLIAHNIRPVEVDWVWANTASSGFLRLTSLEQRYRCTEHVQRLSGKLLHRLHQYCLEGVSGWSEMSVPTLCHLAGLKLQSLHVNHIGPVFVFNGRVPPKIWSHLCAEESTRDRWWHALKW